MVGGNTAALTGVLRELGWLGGAATGAARRRDDRHRLRTGTEPVRRTGVPLANRLGRPRAAAGLGLVRASLSCHADLLPEQSAAHERAVATGAVPAGWCLDDGAILRLTPRGRLIEAVASRPGARATHISTRDAGLVRRELRLELLPGVA